MKVEQVMCDTCASEGACLGSVVSAHCADFFCKELREGLLL